MPFELLVPAGVPPPGAVSVQEMLDRACGEHQQALKKKEKGYSPKTKEKLST